jgi:putative ABC transport system ATP-binding protein
MTHPVLVTRDISKVVSSADGDGEKLVILAAIDLEINVGESVAVMGASGSGKTTLLGILAGLDMPTSGTVALDGHELTALSEEQRARLRGELVGFVFQSFQLLGSLTALENVMLPGELRGDVDPQADAMALLQRVGLGERLRHYPRQLSGGEQQRVAIARAFASRPKILFADEPTGNLDTVTGARIIDLLFELNAAFATTLVLVTHDAHLAERCDRIIELDAGRIVATRNQSAAARHAG